MQQSLHFPDAVPVLDGESIRLRALSEDDVPAWFERATDAESADLAGDPIPESIAQGTAWLQRHRDRFAQKAAVRWAIVPEGSPASVGTVGLSIAPGTPRTVELGIVVGRAHWGRGVGTAATRLACRWAFGSLGVAQIQAEVLQRNPASIRLLDKLGFVRVRAVPGDAPNGADDGYLYVLDGPPTHGPVVAGSTG